MKMNSDKTEENRREDGENGCEREREREKEVATTE
jgi:hypothetical protein